MELDSIECVSYTDGLVDDGDEIRHHSLHHNHHHHQFGSSKPHNATVTSNNSNVLGQPAITPTTSVHELLECPVCTNSMYPPIHQVSSSFSVIFRFFFPIVFCSIVVEFHGSMMGLADLHNLVLVRFKINIRCMCISY